MPAHGADDGDDRRDAGDESEEEAADLELAADRLERPAHLRLEGVVGVEPAVVLGDRLVVLAEIFSRSWRPAGVAPGSAWLSLSASILTSRLSIARSAPRAGRRWPCRELGRLLEEGELAADLLEDDVALAAVLDRGGVHGSSTGPAGRMATGPVRR
jgi:hypothetical protein